MTEATVGPARGSFRWPDPMYHLRSLRRRWLPRDSDSNIVMFAKHELSLIRGPEPDEMQDEMERHILTMCRAFAREGHSGFSAGYAVNVLQKLLRFQPLTPLTGADDEWTDIGGYGGDTKWQNKRCGHVFKDTDGSVYDINGRIFQEPDGMTYTSRDSRVPVTFPYVPKSVTVLVGVDGKPLETAP